MMLRPANTAEVGRIMQLRAEAAEWLTSEVGTDQWSEPWPSDNEMRETIRRSIERGETWMAVNDSGRTIGTVALDDYTADGLWTEAELAEPARYVHRLIIDRDFAGQGIGAQILRWAAERAKSCSAQWLRADVWTDNDGLYRYYARQGFSYVRTVRRDDYPSGGLFQLAL